MSEDHKKATLVFIPFPVLSHLVSAIKLANFLSDRDEYLSITFLIMKMPIDTKITSYIKNSTNSRINFIQLPEVESNSEELRNRQTFVVRFMETQKGPVRDAVAKMVESPESGRIAGLVLDMFCTKMIDVGNEFRAPSYIFFTCGSAVLGLLFHLQHLEDDQKQDLAEYKDSDAEVSVPAYFNPVPARVWPSPVFYKETGFMEMTRKFRETKGIIVNTFLEFERHAIDSLSLDEKVPIIYPVGPILQSGTGEEPDEKEKIKNVEIMEWLDDQPDSSVVFLCFGSRGCFDGDQVREIAVGLEKSGQRFLWSLRKPPPKEKIDYPGEYENPGEVLPAGFLERTAGVGKVIGWAPQMEVLSHRAVGGFVSHCGWNSTLESVWCGVPVATWPLSAEQQANAFQLVKEFEMAVEIKMDYHRDSNVIVPAEKIENSIRELMDPENKIRAKVKDLKEKSRGVLIDGGSSYDVLGRLLNDVMDHVF